MRGGSRLAKEDAGAVVAEVLKAGVRKVIGRDEYILIVVYILT